MPDPVEPLSAAPQQAATKPALTESRFAQVARLGYPLATLLAFAVYGALALWKPGTAWAAIALAMLLAMLSLWFIYCVTGEAEAKCHSLFTFAYAFTFGAFALLLMPVLADQIAPASSAAPSQSHTEGALRLVRGCVQTNAAGSPTLGQRLAPCPASAASSPELPDGIAPIGYRYGWLVSVGGVTARTLAVTSCADDSSKAALLAEKAAAALKVNQATVAGSAAAASAAAAANEANLANAVQKASCAAQGNEDPKRPFVEVSGGVAVPLFVVVLALIGGAVSISRRIPEFQRRNDANYVPTADEPAMPAFRVRESVVFQIMQLVSAPFLAIATMQVIEPNNVASASTLAFATGFFSETILYMIRGMVNGLKPELTKVAGAAMVNLSGRLVWDGEPAASGWDMVRVELRTGGQGEWRSVTAEPDGHFLITGVAQGHYQLMASGGGITASEPRAIEIDNKPPASIEINVKKA
ncbi:hypothetical protein BH11PSE10_BH11PSE10_17160 [soil metagenome]